MLLSFPMGHALANDKHNMINFGINLDLKKAGSHGMLGTRANFTIQPLDKHRVKFDKAYFSNDTGASSSNDGTSFGLQDFFDCLFEWFLN